MAEIKKTIVFHVCPHCHYEWEFHGIGNYIKCPKCGKNHRREDTDKKAEVK